MRKVSRRICHGSSWGHDGVYCGCGYWDFLSSSILDLWEVRGTRDWTSHWTLMKPKTQNDMPPLSKLLCTFHFHISWFLVTVLLSHSYTISHSNAATTLIDSEINNDHFGQQDKNLPTTTSLQKESMTPVKILLALQMVMLPAQKKQAPSPQPFMPLSSGFDSSSIERGSPHPSTLTKSVSGASACSDWMSITL